MYPPLRNLVRPYSVPAQLEAQTPRQLHLGVIALGRSKPPRQRVTILTPYGQKCKLL